MSNRFATSIRVLLAFVAGVLLYQFVVFVGGMLAALAVPNVYFLWFGRARLELAHAVLNVSTFALPIALLVAGGTLAVYRLLAPLAFRPFIWAFGSGVATWFAFWVVAPALVAPASPPGVVPYPPAVLIKQTLLPPWWAVPNMLAPWVGLALAAVLISRRQSNEA